MLTIKDKALPQTLVFTLKLEGASAEMTASHTIDRIAYDMGTASDADATWVSREIGLDIKVVARRAP